MRGMGLVYVVSDTGHLLLKFPFCVMQFYCDMCAVGPLFLSPTWQL